MICLFVNPADTSRHVSSANSAIYANLGLLTLMSSVAASPVKPAALSLGYLDGAVVGNEHIKSFVREHSSEIAFLCLSSLTANHGAAVAIASYAKSLNSSIVVVFGNDHFSALYKTIMRSRTCIDFGFYGSDIVEAFTAFIVQVYTHGILHVEAGDYPGLVYRDRAGEVQRNAENPREYSRLGLVDYSLADSLFPHTHAYLSRQQRTYRFMREGGLRGQVVDIGRGCIKFAGPRTLGVPDNACDFCAIIPGEAAIVTPSAERAWNILRNAYQQGFNYFYVTADELPLTMWPLLRDMARSPPGWFSDLPEHERPKMFGYARAEGFQTNPEKIDVLVETLRFDHFFVGFDGLSEISLRVMNKQPTRRGDHDLLGQNIAALNKIVRSGCMVTAGFVVTHLGITEGIMAENLSRIEEVVSNFPTTFAALDFGPLCPIPGSQAYQYLLNPAYASKKAKIHGLRVDIDRLHVLREKYLEEDMVDMDELVADFVSGCCPDIDMIMVESHLAKLAELASSNGIVVGGGV